MPLMPGGAPVAFVRLEMALRVTPVTGFFLFIWIYGYNRQ